MENSTSSLKLPPGFRFHPTDEELIVQYLKKKVFDFPLPATVIPEADACKSDPWDLPGEAEQMKYFFSTREAKYPSGCRSNRATASGFWKSTGIDKQIVASKTNNLVGMKKTLVFYKGKPPHGSRTNWIMHEYRLTSFASFPHDDFPKGFDAAVGKWVICRIFLKKRGRNENEMVSFGEREVRGGSPCAPVFFDFLAKQRRANVNNLTASSSSELSEITELSFNNQVEDNDENSCCDSLYLFRRTC